MGIRKRLPIKSTSISRKPSKKKNFGKPKVGDTVFKKGDSESRKWTYKNNVEIKGEERAYIISEILKMNNGEVEVIMGLIDFVPKDSLTLEPPSEPTQFFTH